MIFGQLQAQVYPNYSQNIAVTNLNNNGQTGSGGGTITINNNVLSINIAATWATLSYLKIGTVATLTVSPALPNMELGQLSNSSGTLLANFAARIVNNELIFYLTNSPSQWNGCSFTFTKNLFCDVTYTWYLDDDLDGLGDPLNSITQKCEKPYGNYVLNNSDNCPTIPGTSANCASLVPVIQNQNSIKNTLYKVPTASSIASPTISQANQTITYFDGLGRPVQKNNYQATPNSKDIIIPIEYDGFGRQIKEYLPFASTQNDGKIIDQSVLVSNLIAQYQSNYGAANNNPYSEKQLENSPLNRMLQQAAPGSDWALNNHTIKSTYETNVDNDVNNNVKNYAASALWNSSLGLYEISLNRIGTGIYVANQLYKNIIYDENTTTIPIESNGSTVEFKNKEGQVVLKRTYGTVGTATVNEKYDTYYVYDNYGNLTYVIPPKAADLLNTNNPTNITSTAVVTSASGSLNLAATNSIRLLPGFQAQAGSTFSAVIDGSQLILDNLCYQYKYDSRNRLVEKKLPGKQWEFIVYDKLDRPVATGPVNSPFSDLSSTGWLITKYDDFNRPVYTGWTSATPATAVGRNTLQQAQNLATVTVLNESKLTSGSIDGIQAYYSNLVAPTSFNLLTVNYYDNYTFPSNAPAIVIPTTIEGQTALSTSQIKGLAAASWVRVCTTSTASLGETSAIFYDAKARTIRSYTQNYLGGYTYTDHKLDAFSGQLKYTLTGHKRLNTDTELLTKDAFTYSAQDRLLTQTHYINGATTGELMTDNTYDELGQLILKKVGNTTTSPTQKIDYTYNIRGWLTNINDISTLTKSGDPKDLFAFKLSYNNTNTTGAALLYNGNIAETQWTSASEVTPVIRAYGYHYDNLNRLKSAIFKRGSVAVNNAYNESLTYDKNGNIMTFLRNGGNESTATQIDNLIYSYSGSNTTNQLMKVADSSNKTTGFIDGSNTGDDYSYDANGNMITDANKNITSIVYNYLNLPTKITFGSGGNIVYLYNATGEKIQKVVTDGANITTTDYLDGYQYVKTTATTPILKFFPTTEGFVECTGSSYKYIYQYKDHLGNIRVSYDKNLVIQEENNYYPFGLKHNGYNGNTSSTNDGLKYKFNGKELQDELGLNMYDYGMRNYDPALGRWMNIDPLAELSRKFSPYTYALNNPVYFIDPDGMKAEAGQSGNYYDWDEKKYKNKDSGETVDAETAIASHMDDNGEPPVNFFKVENSKFYNVFKQKNNGNYQTGDGIFDVYGHGGINELRNSFFADSKNKDIPKWLDNAEQFDERMSQVSPAYKKKMEMGKLAIFTLNLFICQSAGGNLSMAQRLSEAHPLATIVGFDGWVMYGQDNYAKNAKNVNYFIKGVSSDIKVNLADRNRVVYQNGKEVSRMLYSEYLKLNPIIR